MKKIQIFLYVIFMAISSCSKKGNLAECSDTKKDINLVMTKDELESIEAENPSQTCERLTYHEDALKLIQAAAESSSETAARKNYKAAAEILEKLISFYPTDYSRYALTAAAYAGQGGIELVSFLSTLSSGGDGAMFTLGPELVPSPGDADYDEVKAALAKAAFWITEKIEKQDVEKSTSDDLQSSIYLMASTLVITNGLLSDAASFDPEKIQNMSVEDLDTIIDNLDTIAAAANIPGLEDFANSNELTDAEKKALLEQAMTSQ